MEKELLQIPEENILISFYIDEQEYVVLADDPEVSEEEPIYFAKRDYLDGNNSLIRSIENKEEYNKVVEKYEELLNLMEGEENENNN